MFQNKLRNNFGMEIWTTLSILYFVLFRIFLQLQIHISYCLPETLTFRKGDSSCFADSS